MKDVLFYESADDVLTKAPANSPAHSGRVDELHARGSLLIVGTYADPQQGAMATFTTSEGAEEFASGDPFVLNGVVRRWEIRAWNEVLTGP